MRVLTKINYTSYKNVIDVLVKVPNLVQTSGPVVIVEDKKIRSSQGFFTIQQTCPECGGYGRIIE